MTMSTPSEASSKCTYFDASSNRSASTSLTSSQDPGYVPTPYTHDSGIDHGAPISYVCDTNTKNPFSRKLAPSALDSLEVAGLEPSTDLSTDQDPSLLTYGSKEIEIPDSYGWQQPYQHNSNQRTDSPLDGMILDLTTSSDGELQSSNRATSPTGSATRKNVFTNKGGLPISSGTFINGAGTVGPHASTEPNDELQRRARDADFSLTQKQKSKIIKAEVKDNQRLSKIIKEEAKVEKKALDLAINELANLQGFQKQAVKDEAKAHTNHSKVLSAFRKHESTFFASKSRYDSLQGQVNAEGERLEAVRESAKTATERVAEKSQEVDGLRKMFGIDERERGVKLGELKETRTSSLWRI